MGDSQTYGVGVEREEAWPARLERKSGRKVYNMAFPGWGPGQGYLLAHQALQLRPKVVIYAFYFGNDFFDVFDLLARRPELDHGLPGPLLDSAKALELKSPLSERVRFLFAQGDTIQSAEPTRLSPSFRAYLSRHSRIIGLLRVLRSTIAGEARQPTVLLSRDMDRALQGMSARQRTFVTVYRDSAWKTLLTAPYRNAVVDVGDPRIRAGVQGTELFLGRMDSLCHRDHVDFLVLLVPTKETVFAGRMHGVQRGTSLDSVVTNERRLHDDLTTWLSRRNIEYLDLLPVFRASKEQPYFEDADGHPARLGHSLIGDAVLRRLQTSRPSTALPPPPPGSGTRHDG